VSKAKRFIEQEVVLLGSHMYAALSRLSDEDFAQMCEFFDGYGFANIADHTNFATCETLEDWLESSRGWRALESVERDGKALIFEGVQMLRGQPREAMIIVYDLGEWRIVVC